MLDQARTDGSNPHDLVAFVGANIVAPEGAITGGWVGVRDGVISSIGKIDSPTGLAHDVSEVGGAWIVPGFVDLHCHGGGGASFDQGDVDQARMAAEFHRRRGSTSLLASLVSGPHEHLLRASRTLARVAKDDETILGIHLEGPYLSHARCGAHDPKHLRNPSPVEVSELLRAGAGFIRQLTFAPELPGAIAMLRLLISQGVIGAIGHTDATAAQTKAAIDAGARLATHLCNAMPALHHRDGGPVLEILNDERVFVELINDGVHLDPAFVHHLIKSVGAHRIAMITDAVCAAGQQNGRYKVGGREVDLVDGIVRLATPEAPLAGSSLTMANAFANTVALTESVVTAARMCSTTPSHILGLRDRGAIVRNRRADLVVLSETFEVVEVWQRGERVFRRETIE